MFVQTKYFYIHLAAIFEWMLSVNLEMFELSYVVEFSFFSSYMISNLLSKREEEKPLMLQMSWYEAATVRVEENEEGLNNTSVRTVTGPWLKEQ